MINKRELDLENQERAEQAQNVRVGGLCRVETFDPTLMLVDVQPLSKALDAGEYRTRPQVLKVPVALIRGDGFVLRPWYKAGDVGVLVYMDHDIDRIMDSGQECEPNTERNHGEEDAVFVGAFVPANNPVKGLPDDALVMGRDDGSLYVAIKKDHIEIKGNVHVIEGDVVVDQDIIGQQVSLPRHIHTGDSGGKTMKPDPTGGGPF